MYSKITNPKTGRKVSINGKIGKRILSNYINIIGGSIKKTNKSCVTNNDCNMGYERCYEHVKDYYFRTNDEHCNYYTGVNGLKPDPNKRWDRVEPIYEGPSCYCKNIEQR